ncbi:MAG: hypothetical protein CSA72_08395 [Rhodobacterales bacterium]|nr:MAG: hypothetical protein CSA72_08395 [Rhodobacterales bacterium]
MSREELSGGLSFSSRRGKNGVSLPLEPWRMTEDPPSPESEPMNGTFSSGSDDAAHLDEFRAADLSDGLDAAPDDVQEIGEDGEPIHADAGPDQIDKAAFAEVFKIAFSVPGMVDATFQPVAIQPQEREGARAASDAVHSLLEIYYPAALRPGSETFAHLMVAGPFIVGKVMVARACIAAKNAKRVEAAQAARQQSAPKPPQSAPDAPADPVNANQVPDWHLPGQEAA